ncbi:hypothetical protein PVAP13_8KG339006 [Panicum virgatum]|uniref:Uncharacterized protein n=1 Tax=Panicum virgatum TaxID=38727 RepID=A0A8T0PM15_PANVG|nr:hypothetical protein PVAP13_8KG339006 [Panicum virgatum]
MAKLKLPATETRRLQHASLRFKSRTNVDGDRVTREVNLSSLFLPSLFPLCCPTLHAHRQRYFLYATCSPSALLFLPLVKNANLWIEQTPCYLNPIQHEFFQWYGEKEILWFK